MPNILDAQSTEITEGMHAALNDLAVVEKDSASQTSLAIGPVTGLPEGDIATAVRVANHFGFGEPINGIAHVARDPYGWARRQVVENMKKLIPGLDKAGVVVSNIDELQRCIGRTSDPASQANREACGVSTKGMVQYRRKHALLLIKEGITTRAPYYEKMVHFWMNHFTMIDKYGIPAVPFANEVIRPHVFGSFRDMLKAATLHPCMLRYLHNQLNNVKRVRVHGQIEVIDKINEDHARELLELHTVSLRARYSQKDIIQLARAMSGWTVDQTGEEYTAVFKDELHDPSPTFEIMHKIYKNEGANTINKILNDLSMNERTAEFICIKLVQRFIGVGFSNAIKWDIIRAMQKIFMSKEGGDLAGVAIALVHYHEYLYSIGGRCRRFSMPMEYLIRIFRSTKVPLPEDMDYHAILETMGQTPFNPKSPEGWEDSPDAWMNANGLAKRIKYARWFVHYASRVSDLGVIRRGLQEEVFSLMSGMRRSVINEASGDGQAITLMLSSPHFMWE